MTGPDRIWIDRHGGNWSPVDGGTQDVDYIRRDPAVLAALPEVQALIAAAYEVAAQVVDTCNREGPYQAIGAACRVRSLTPADATAALAARDAAMRAQGLREAAEWYRVAGWKLDEDDVPDAILARAAGIEGDATNGG